MAALLTTILYVLVAITHFSSGEKIEVYSAANSEVGNETNIDEALTNLSSNTVVYLAAGSHQVTEFAIVRNLVNVTFIGEEVNNTIISCNDRLGLAFINITDLRMESLTIDSCGLLETYLKDIVDEINSTTMMFHHVFYDVGVSVVFGNIYNLVLTRVNVVNSTVGIMAINVLGNSSFDELRIENNNPLNGCKILRREEFISHDVYGGGVLVLFSDSLNETDKMVTKVNLTISKSTFANNSNCGGDSGISTVYQSSITAQMFGYTLTGGGGLSLFLAQFMYSVTITIVETDFTNNAGLYGGGLHIQHFHGSSDGNILLQNCSFVENGVIDATGDLYSSVGAGGFVFLNTLLPNGISRQTIKIDELRSNIVEFMDCIFMSNKGRNSAGLYFYSFNSELTTRGNENQVRLTNCEFYNNTVSTSTAIMTFIELKYSWIQPGLQVYLDSILVKRNNGSPTNSNSITGLYESLISIISVNMTLSGTCIFEGNSGSSVSAVTSNIYMKGEILFMQNTATAGGALQLLTGSSIVISDNANLSFVRNSAAVAGGAIYTFLDNYYIDTSQSSQQCFLWFDTVDYICEYSRSCIDPRKMNFNISFIDNVAPMGSAVYGSALLSCPWKSVFDVDVRNNMSGYELLSHLLPNNMFSIESSSNGSNRTINTLPVRLDVQNPGTADDPILSYPGNLIEVNALALDALNQSVPLAITSVARKSQSLFENNLEANSQLGLSGYWFLPGNIQNQTVQLYLYGNANNNTVQVSLFSTTSSASADLFLKLQNCSYGFVLVEDEQQVAIACRCEAAINEFQQLRCNETTGKLIISSNFWVGKTQAGKYTLHACLYDYCMPGERVLNSSSNDDDVQMEINAQCSVGRGGILCGKCIEDYGIAFGSTGCSKCGHGEWLIIIFLIMGIVLIGLIAFLDFTVAKGYVNGVIFFANITEFLIPIYSEYVGSSNIFFIISLINFDPGFRTCLYPKMDALTRSGLSLMFPLYLFALMLLCIIVARHSHRLSRSGFSGPKTFATLLLLCYSAIFKTCVEILAFVKLNGDQGQYVGWRIDPNVRYGQGAHGALIAVAIIFLLFYIIPFSLFLFSPPAVLTRTRCGEACRIKFQPIFDAFWGPFKSKFCFWPGLRCILRLIPYSISSTVTYPDNAFGITMFAIAFLLLHVFAQPFKRNRLNHLETSLLFNLVFLAMGSLYYPQKLDEYFSSSSPTGTFVIIFLLFAYSILFTIILFHLQERFPKYWNALKVRLIKFGKSCYKCRCCCRRKKKEKTNDTEEEGTDNKIINFNDQFDQFAKQRSYSELTDLQNVTYSILREPLIEIIDELNEDSN